MLIKFAISNFLSFNTKQIFSMEAGKARKHSARIYDSKIAKLTKCKTVFGANASGKSNLIEAFNFVQTVVNDGFKAEYVNKYFRQNADNKNKDSVFEIEVLIDGKKMCYGFSVLLSNGTINNEWLYEIMYSGTKKLLYERCTTEETFTIGEYFKNKDSINKLLNYGEDSTADTDYLFLTIINNKKNKMYAEHLELNILKQTYEWFTHNLSISFPSESLTGYPYFTDANLEEIAEILGALGTGVSSLQIVDVPTDAVRNKIPRELYNKIVSDLEKINLKAKSDETSEKPSIVARAYKEFYKFEIDLEDRITIKTIEFGHENNNVFFNLNEESDGTARLLDLVEMFFDNAESRVFVIDEIDRCLHPAMTVKILELFLKRAERKNTQLIITCHESRILAKDILRNDEILFVMKTVLGDSIINALEKYQLRADKSVYAALFDGTLEALPIFNNERLEKLT